MTFHSDQGNPLLGDPIPPPDPVLAAWLDARCGKLTASRMGDAISFLKNGTSSQKRSDYMRDLLAERLTGHNVRHYVSPAMEHGLLYEAEAKQVYTEHTGIEIQSSGFYNHRTIDMFGATPDGEIWIEPTRLAEIKCPTTSTFIQWVIAGIVPPEYEPQMLAQIAVTKHGWCTFIAYDPRIKEPKRRLFIREYWPTPAQVQKIEEQAQQFLAELDKLFDAFVNAP